VGDVIIERERVRNTGPRKGEPLLVLEKWNFLGAAKIERMVPAAKEIAIEQGWDVGGRDRPVGDATGGVSTSTIGSAKNIPREPLRTIRKSVSRRAASSAIARETASAPTDRALESAGT